MSDAEHKKWLMQESYFGCSWTHIFYKWKCSKIMLGNTTRRFLLSMPQKSRRVINLGWGSAGSLFEVFDIFSGLHGM